LDEVQQGRKTKRGKAEVVGFILNRIVFETNTVGRDEIQESLPSKISKKRNGQKWEEGEMLPSWKIYAFVG